MNRVRIALFFVLPFVAASVHAQTAALRSSGRTLDARGGELVLTATAKYEAQPSAVGWSIGLPADWKLVGIGGPNTPAIAPEPGSAGTLEFAFTSAPPQQAQFTVVVRYPANAPSCDMPAAAIIRAGGKLANISLAPVKFTAGRSETKGDVQ